MIVNKEKIEKDIWKKYCFPYLVCSLILIWTVIGFIVFFIAFLFNLPKYLNMKKGLFYIAKAKCNKICEETSEDDTSIITTQYAYFYNFERYKLKSQHSEIMHLGKTYYLIVQNKNKIIHYYPADDYDIDMNDFHTKDEIKYYYQEISEPMPTDN